jgi:hypothetical protein
MVAIVAGILVASALVGQGDGNGNADVDAFSYWADENDLPGGDKR